MASLVAQTRGDKPENARSGSPAAQTHFTDQIVLIQTHFTDQIVLILMILGATQIIQILWYIYAQTYVWYRSSETRPAASTAGAATANGSPAARHFGASTAGTAKEAEDPEKDIVMHWTNCPSTANSAYTSEASMYYHCIARQQTTQRHDPYQLSAQCKTRSAAKSASESLELCRSSSFQTWNTVRKDAAMTLRGVRINTVLNHSFPRFGLLDRLRLIRS